MMLMCMIFKETETHLTIKCPYCLENHRLENNQEHIHYSNCCNLKIRDFYRVFYRDGNKYGGERKIPIVIVKNLDIFNKSFCIDCPYCFQEHIHSLDTSIPTTKLSLCAKELTTPYSPFEKKYKINYPSNRMNY